VEDRVEVREIDDRTGPDYEDAWQEALAALQPPRASAMDATPTDILGPSSVPVTRRNERGPYAIVAS